MSRGTIPRVLPSQNSNLLAISELSKVVILVGANKNLANNNKSLKVSPGELETTGNFGKLQHILGDLEGCTHMQAWERPWREGPSQSPLADLQDPGTQQRKAKAVQAFKLLEVECVSS